MSAVIKRIRKNSIWGSGPKLLSSTLIYFAAVLYIDKIYLQNSIISNKIWVINFLSGTLTAIGLVILIILIRLIFTIYKSGFLCRKGIYGFCRHPLYANFIFVLVPGFCLRFNSWIILTTPVFMYFSFKHYIKQEEQGLIEQFGEDYIQYRKEVNLLLIIVASVSGTLVLPRAGQPLNDIYHSIWFYMLLGLLCLNIFACSLRRLSVLWQRPETAMTVFNHHEGIKGMPAYRETNVSLSGVPAATVIQLSEQSWWMIGTMYSARQMFPRARCWRLILSLYEQCGIYQISTLPGR
ncbi:MAG: cytochrome c biogenesis protein ResB [Smithella sp.]